MNLERLLIEKIENRILVGIIAFVGTMIIIGWIAINETARMAAFAEQYEGRAIERGAYLFNQNCSTCHGIDGRGLNGRAPGLNNPHLFGYDFMATERRALENLQRQANDQQSVLDEYAEIETAINNGELEGDDLTNGLARLQELEPLLAEASAQIADLEAQMQTAIDNGYTPDTPDRLVQVGWAGTLENYLLTTLIHGRPGSQSYWPTGQGMAAWGQIAGGPLRQDQLEDLTSYILNWERNWTLDDLNAVNQFAKVPADAALVGEVSTDPPIGTDTDVDAILAELPSYTGDPINGQTIYQGKYACAGCHSNEIVAPPTELTWLSATTGEGGRPYAGDPTHYVVESIVNPGAYVVSPYPNGAMPANFGQRITLQELADIIAYLSSYDA